jgi:ribonuclease HII
LKVAGIDEAGRGSLIGPLVIAFFLTNDIKALGKIKDSKKLSKKQRSFIYKKLKNLGKFKIIKIWPKDIDERNINILELEAIKKLVKNEEIDKLYIDCFLKDKNIFNSLKSDNIRDVIAEYKADEKYSVVAAASIVAKVVRDAEIKKLKNELGDFGSGYPSDEKTINFVKENLKVLEQKGVLRKKWKTYKLLKSPVQKKLE